LRTGKDRIVIDTPEASTLVSRVAQAFQVSRQAAMIRLKTLELLARPDQESLL
jgi:Zn-dependent peptidase ImmA (M78 family)